METLQGELISEFVAKLSATKKAQLIDGKFYYTEDDAFAFFLEQQETHHQELQKAREEVKTVIEEVRNLMAKDHPNIDERVAFYAACNEIEKRLIQSELDQPNEATGENGYAPGAKDIKGSSGEVNKPIS